MSARPVSGESALLGLPVAASCLCVLTRPSLGACMRLGGGGGQSSLLFLLLRTLILWDQGPTLMTSFNINCFLGSPVSKYSHTVGQGFQHRNLAGLGVGETQTFSP